MFRFLRGAFKSIIFALGGYGNIQTIQSIFPGLWPWILSATMGAVTALWGWVSGGPSVLWIPAAFLVALLALLLCAAFLWIWRLVKSESFIGSPDRKYKTSKILECPIEIYFDPSNPRKLFWSLESVMEEKDGHAKCVGQNWEYRVMLRNISDKTVRNVRVQVEAIGLFSTRPEQSHFDINKNACMDVQPGQEVFAVLMRWYGARFVAGMMVGEVYGPIKVTVTADDIPPATKTFRFDPEKEPMVSEMAVITESL